MTKNLVEIRKNRLINIDICGNDPTKPTLFLFHGLGGRGEQWDYFKEKFKSQANIIIPDFLGHGKSDHPKQLDAYGFDEMYQDVKTLFNQFSTKDNYIVAHSYSATWTCRLMHEDSSKIKKVVLITPTTCKPKKVIPHIYYFPSWFLELIQNKLGEQFYKLAFTANSDPDLVKKEIEASKKISMHVIKGMIYSTKHISPIDVSNLQTKTLLITAEKDKVVPQKESIEFYQHLPNVKMIEIKDSGHLPFLEKPEMVYQYIQEFLF